MDRLVSIARWLSDGKLQLLGATGESASKLTPLSAHVFTPRFIYSKPTFFEDAPDFTLKAKSHYRLLNLEQSILQVIDKAPTQPLLYCLINLNRVNCIIDTGCAITIISETLAKKVEADIIPDPGITVGSASGTNVSLVGRTVVEMETLGMLIQVPCLVSKDAGYDCLLSYLFLQTVGCIIDTMNNMIVNWPARCSPECLRVKYKDVCPQVSYKIKTRPNKQVILVSAPEHMDRRYIAKKSQKEALELAYRFLNPASNCDRCGKKRIKPHVCVTFEQLLSESSDVSETSEDEFNIEPVVTRQQNVTEKY